MTATGNPALDAGEESFQDHELLAALRAGEDAAFGELFSRHADAVRRLARSIAADRSDVEDLTAEAFFRVLQAIRRGAGPVDNVRSYLLIVTRRVAWEWSERRRDVPVSDEILSHRSAPNPDTSGQSHERNLITRAFTSLPERWRSVLWKVEVEGERPAVVAPNFGLSPNATAALARRARRGLRAAYLQAHLSTHHGSTVCRSILEKLGAYTAGTIKGAERRRVRAHLVSCSSCQSTHDELQDVCAGLRSYAGLMVAPVAIGGLLANKTGFWATLKGLVSSAGAKLTLAGSSVLAAGVLGLTAAPDLVDDAQLATLDFPGRNDAELVITEQEPPQVTPATGSLSSSLSSTSTAQAPAHADRPPDSRRDHDDEIPMALPAEPAIPVVEHHETSLVLRGADEPTKTGGNQGVSTETEGSSVMVGPPGDPTCAETTGTSTDTKTTETTKTLEPTEDSPPSDMTVQTTGTTSAEPTGKPTH
jgi:RNA polymerase sigma factor (sigma-70 family)